MKKLVVKWVCVTLATFLVPFCMKNAVPQKQNGSVTSTPTDPAQTRGDTIRVWFPDGDKTEEMPLRDYIVGVTAVEMPVAFAHDALCAQALASLTYALYQRKHPKNELAGGAEISTDPAVYQAYWTAEEMRERWGDDFEENYAKICRAVDEVIGFEIVYGDEPVAAAFHAVSPGRTESAENVWGTEIPYLVSVESEGDSVSPKYQSSLTVNARELKAKLGLEAEGSPADWFSEPDYSEAGTLLSVEIAGKAFTGQELRRVFGLQSAAFTIDCDGDTVTFRVRGYGHGVGLSQYGADHYARQGMTWREIVAHYYPGTRVEERDAI